MKNLEKSAVAGAICGDIIGSFYESNPTRDYDFDLFTKVSTYTDDSIMTLAVAGWFNKRHDNAPTEFNQDLVGTQGLIRSMQKYGRVFPRRGYGRNFLDWINNPRPAPYNSYGNGSAMRVSSVGEVAKNLEEVWALASLTAGVSHNHPEGVKGARAVASAIFLARHGKSKQEIKDYIEKEFGYNLHRKRTDIAPTYKFDVSCQKSVPESIICYLEANSYEDAIRKAVSLGGDADTMACIAGSIAAVTPGMEIPDEILTRCLQKLDFDLMAVLERFHKYYEE